MKCISQNLFVFGIIDPEIIRVRTILERIGRPRLPTPQAG
jgi:hypothetical protein